MLLLLLPGWDFAREPDPGTGWAELVIRYWQYDQMSQMTAPYKGLPPALQDLARRTSRAADLIRTRIDLQLSRQNIELLQTLNQRTKIQMRLQQTVEGLSVAAVSYYILGLIGYLAKGAKEAGLTHIEPGIVIAALMPVVVLTLALAVRSVRRSHKE